MYSLTRITPQPADQVLKRRQITVTLPDDGPCEYEIALFRRKVETREEQINVDQPTA